MTEAGPLVSPPQPRNLGATLGRNIAALKQRRDRQAAAATFEERLAEAITRFTGSIRFVYIHLILFGGWILANLGAVPLVRPWDPTFVVLAMIASVEAIFLSTFVLITQNRMSAENDRRADLDLQINLLAEHEVTRLIAIVSAVAAKLDVALPAPEIDELKNNVAPEAVLDALEDPKK